MVRVDVLVVGGGLQGLLLLDQFASAGRSCALVTPSNLGDGQTLHSHLAWLVREDSAIARALPAWKAELARFRPEPFRELMAARD